jgi:hypothetical protein
LPLTVNHHQVLPRRPNERRQRGEAKPMNPARQRRPSHELDFETVGGHRSFIEALPAFLP